MNLVRLMNELNNYLLMIKFNESVNVNVSLSSCDKMPWDNSNMWQFIIL